MFADSKGYLVTEMVWEEFSDADADGDQDGEAEDGVLAVAVPGPKQALTVERQEEEEDQEKEEGRGGAPRKASIPASACAAAPAIKEGKEKKAAGPAKKAPKGQVAGKSGGTGTQKSMTSFFGAKP